MRRTLLTAALLATALPAAAQVGVRTPMGGVFSFSTDDPKRAMLGVSTTSSGQRDTLGLLVSAVTAGGPAEKAGIEEGNRLVSINGVNLRLSRDDARDEDMQGVNQNRLIREMRKVKAGDNVTLEVWGGGRTRTVTVKTVAAEELEPRRTAAVASRTDDRAALGIYLGSGGSKRDTVGVFVSQVVEGGPAEKAGIVEGDRIASINGVDLRVPREDAGDWNVASTRVDRLEREVGKLKAGDAADLVVVSGGRSRPVKIVAVKASDLPGGFGYTFRSGPGDVRIVGPGGTLRTMPRIRIERRIDDGDVQLQLDGAMRELESLGPRIRAEVEGSLRRDLPRAMDDLRKSMHELEQLHPKVVSRIVTRVRL